VVKDGSKESETAFAWAVLSHLFGVRSWQERATFGKSAKAAESGLPVKHFPIDFQMFTRDDLGVVASGNFIGCQSRSLGTLIEPPADPGLQRLEIIVQFRAVDSARDVNDATEVRAEEFQSPGYRTAPPPHAGLYIEC
jgi:hypothetical protein